ncbi:MAG TPA: phospholipase A [Polyangiaceae bacterium]
MSSWLALQAPSPAAAEEAAPASQTAAQESPESRPAMDSGEPDILTFHRSNYVLTGFDRATQVKFQFSFKYDLWPNRGKHTVYLAYTQKSLWDLYETSSPFRESNYAPEAFYAHYHATQRWLPDPGCGLFAEQAGFEHESNGEASEASRSWNRLFVNVQATCAKEPIYGLLGLRLWYPFGLQENPDIIETQGYGELVLGVGIDLPAAHTNALVTLALRKGASSELLKGSLELDARWRPTYQRLLGESWKFTPFVWGQLFTGYGETLGTFDSTTTSVRVGFGFSDQAQY